ncbi:MAG: M20/M25/M40 family metallo-hydrolase [Acidobacteriota bacterium]|nr:M20/M25/M40 family metallo-hydrolase [Acidobacteriota bacterium]
MNTLRPGIPLRRRLALYVPLGGLILLILIATWFFGRRTTIDRDQAWTEVDYAALSEVELLRRYVSIDTSPTTGSELAGADFLASELEKIGLKPVVETFGDRHANVWAILEGDEPEALVLHNHIDVHPIADPDGWDFDPYGAEIDQAWLYGRGVFDMKSLAIVQLLAMRDLQARRQRPRKSVIFLATGSEEVGSELGTRWILEQRPELRSRFWSVLTEGGIVEPTSRTDIKYWGIEFAQKQFATGYACAPTREELEDVGRQITAWRDDAEALILTPEVTAFTAAYAPSRDRDLYRDALANPHRVILNGPTFRELPAYLQSQFRDEVVPFEPEPDPEGGFRMKVIFHLLPGQSLERARSRLLPPWILQDVAFVLGDPLGADSGSPIDTPVFTALVGAVRETYPQATVGPYFLPWSATDSRFFRQAGIPSYGFSPFIIFSTDTFRVDGRNERISLPGYMTGFELYRQAVFRIVG